MSKPSEVYYVVTVKDEVSTSIHQVTLETVAQVMCQMDKYSHLPKSAILQVDTFDKATKIRVGYHVIDLTDPHSVLNYDEIFKGAEQHQLKLF